MITAHFASPPPALALSKRLVHEATTGTRPFSSGLVCARSTVHGQSGLVCAKSPPRALVDSETSPEAPDVTWSVLFYNDWVERYGSSEAKNEQSQAEVSADAAELNEASPQAPDVAWPVFFYGDWLQKYGSSQASNQKEVGTKS